ncbi:hypothetical protein A1D22_01455 [Pasteurellaceae bacterium LFhippo2]|nr:hypothetical protein [Pasteurellaceae bacterium LFhippo2]
MKKQQLVKFSLTLVCAAVLAACSSGGGSGGNDAAKKAEADKIAAQQAAAKAAAAKAEADKAAAAKAAAAKAEADKAAAAKAAAAKAEADKVAETKTATAVEVGHKLVQKVNSNFILNIKEDTANSSTGRADTMDVKLHPSLDTVVVSIPLDKNGQPIPNAPVGYVEDFDFRGNVDSTTGTHTLQHIYKTGDGSTLVHGATRTKTETKTATAGAQTGEALVYQTGRTNYISTSEKVVGGNSDIVKRSDFRERKDTVAEVYGHRTFVEGDSLTGTYDEKAPQNVVGANAPFGKLVNGTYSDVQLAHVQYGRVTSKMDKVKLESVKDGVDAGKTGTRVVSYGAHGANGTENSYFYRGVEDTAYNANLTNNLSKYYFNSDKADGQLTYQGHAVTYGLTHKAINANIPDTSKIPNAIAANPTYNLPELVSGTHVHATVDLATKGVTGNLYDVWSVDGVKSNSDLAKFSGTLTNDGAIKGTSTRLSDDAAGTFNANLFGAQAQELGGALASKATDAKNSWGAVFGAKVQQDKYVAPPVVVPPAPPVVVPPAPPSVWGVKTDENN